MARIESKVIFVTTSPRTPAKMIPEIGLLHAHFAGQRWNNENQRAFMELLREENFFNGEGANDPAFSAREKIWSNNWSNGDTCYDDYHFRGWLPLPKDVK